jgi:hypothetical protein
MEEEFCGLSMEEIVLFSMKKKRRMVTWAHQELKGVHEYHIISRIPCHIIKMMVTKTRDKILFYL